MKKKNMIGLLTFMIGLAVLITGATFLAIRMTETQKMADGDYLVEIGQWRLATDENVVWNFSEIGSGTLTTNGHTNDYDFKWAMQDGKLQIETDWLYTLEDEYDYRLEQGTKTLILTKDGGEIKFVAATK